jgi:hypothetical protein
MQHRRCPACASGRRTRSAARTHNKHSSPVHLRRKHLTHQRERRLESHGREGGKGREGGRAGERQSARVWVHTASDLVVSVRGRCPAALMPRRSRRLSLARSRALSLSLSNRLPEVPFMLVAQTVTDSITTTPPLVNVFSHTQIARGAFHAVSSGCLHLQPCG